MNPEPYSIQQVRLKTPDIRTQVRNLAIVFNRKISETHKGMEADPTDIKILVDPEKIIPSCSKIQKNRTLGTKDYVDQWKTFSKKVNNLVEQTTIIPGIKTRWTQGIDFTQSKHLLKAFSNLQVGNNWDFLDSARCTQLDPDIWFPYNNYDIQLTPAVYECMLCPVRRQCLQAVWETEKRIGNLDLHGTVGAIPAHVRRAHLALRQANQNISKLEYQLKHKVVFQDHQTQKATPAQLDKLHKELVKAKRKRISLKKNQAEVDKNYMRLVEEIQEKIRQHQSPSYQSRPEPEPDEN